MKSYLNNWPSQKINPSFRQEQKDLIKSIPRIIFWFVIPALLAGLIVRINENYLLGIFPSEILWGFIFFFIIMFAFARWVEK